MKSKISSGIVLSALALFLVVACTPTTTSIEKTESEISENIKQYKLELRTFFNKQNAAVSRELAYINGVESALSDFETPTDNINYENVTTVNAQNIKEYQSATPFFINLGTFDEELQNEIKSVNLVPSILSNTSIKEVQYSGEFDQFSLNPDPVSEAKIIAESLPENAYIVYSDEGLYEAMCTALFEVYPEDSVAGITLLPPHSNAFKPLVADVIAQDFDVLLLLTNEYDFTNFIYELSATECEKDVYVPSYARRFFTLPPNYSSASFNTFVFDFNYHLLLSHSELPTKNEGKFSDRDYHYFVDGYSAAHFLLKNYQNTTSPTELINNLHNSYLTRNLTGSFLPI